MKSYSVKIWREIQGQNKIIKFGPFSTLKDADVIARHEAHEPKTKKVSVILAPNEVKREYQGGEFYKGNPATRKGTAKVYRKSQVTKKPPTKRLIARRKTNVKKGYFPNPVNPPVKESNVSKLMATMYNAAELAKKKSPASTLQARVSYAQGLMVAANVLGAFPRGEMQSLMDSIRAAHK